MNKIIIYHIPRSRSERIIWLAEEMGLPYEKRRVAYPDGLRTPEYLAINPLSAVPAIEDGSLRMRESSAIATYLLDQYGDGTLDRRFGDSDYPDYLMWLHSAEGTFFRPLARYWMHTEVLPEERRIAAVAVDGHAEWQRYLAYIDKSLSGREFLLGDRFSAADVLIGHTLSIARYINQIPVSMGAANAYLDQLAGRRAYQRAIGED